MSAAAAMIQWNCSTCTYANPTNELICEMCLTARGTAATTAGASTISSVRATTLPLLTQTWRSYGNSSRIASVTVFSQSTMHIFSNYVHHVPFVVDISPYSKREKLIRFDFAEKAIMACKAALFHDYTSFDRIMTCTDSRQAKSLGRAVSSFDQRVWDANQCSIVRQITIAKLGWNNFRSALLATSNNIIAECTDGDWVWGSSLNVSDDNVYYPGRWKGMNILGWALMEARDEARKQQQHQSVSISSLPSSSPTTTKLTPKRQRIDNNPKCNDENIDLNSIKFLATQYSLDGPNAFGRLKRTAPDQHVRNNKLTDLSQSVKGIVETSFPDAKNMRGERGNKYVTRMLMDIYVQGLHMHGSSDSSVNRTVIPAFRYIVSELNKLETLDKKRVLLIRNLAEACQDCQQVQARVIIRIYGDLTSQTETLESQLKYSLVQLKEVALQILITKYHSLSCDLDHTKVGPQKQRAHLWSGYISLIGETFGLDGIEAANDDRFLSNSLGVIRNVHNGRNLNVDGVGDEPLKRYLMDELSSNLCVKEWLSGLIGDINNQSSNAARMIDRACIVAWASANMEADAKHRIFYDDSRVEEYSDLDPKEPTDDNQFEPFLSPVVLVEMLVKVGMLTRIQ